MSVVVTLQYFHQISTRGMRAAQQVQRLPYPHRASEGARLSFLLALEWMIRCIRLPILLCLLHRMQTLQAWSHPQGEKLSPLVVSLGRLDTIEQQRM